MMPGRVSINFTRLLFTFKCQHQGSLKIEFILHFPTAESNGNPFGSILIAFTYLNLILLVVASSPAEEFMDVSYLLTFESI